MENFGERNCCFASWTDLKRLACRIFTLNKWMLNFFPQKVSLTKKNKEKTTTNNIEKLKLPWDSFNLLKIDKKGRKN